MCNYKLLKGKLINKHKDDAINELHNTYLLNRKSIEEVENIEFSDKEVNIDLIIKKCDYGSKNQKSIIILLW